MLKNSYLIIFILLIVFNISSSELIIFKKFNKADSTTITRVTAYNYISYHMTNLKFNIVARKEKYVRKTTNTIFWVYTYKYNGEISAISQEISKEYFDKLENTFDEMTEEDSNKNYCCMKGTHD